MSEVLGIVAASTQFVELGFKFFKFAKAVYDQVQNASEYVQKWLVEIEQLKELVADCHWRLSILEVDFHCKELFTGYARGSGTYLTHSPDAKNQLELYAYNIHMTHI
ncbi:hypothetical protein BKA56DRAFT_619096 [Ilyonectria sp. MPI-CAGE-AT-0026]|nr:hypothetical protein BKA56DRAFT_619096 [Ilyonectria sp. MPI-CAGE-AT-0026]